MISVPSDIKIRYNTQSDGINQKWRVLVNGTEHLYDEVVIQGTVVTSRDYMGDSVGYKHHITAINSVMIEEGKTAYITESTRSSGIKRDLLKTFSYRIFGSLASGLIGYATTGSFGVGFAVGAGDLLIKPVIYFLHERAWRKIR